MLMAGCTAGGRGRSSPRGFNGVVVGDVPYSAAGSEDDGGGSDVAKASVNGDDESYDQDELLSCCACGEMVREPALLLVPCLHVCCASCYRSAPPPAACPLCGVVSAAASESSARVSDLLGACAQAAAAAERQCTLCWQSGTATTARPSRSSASTAVVLAEHECRQCGLRLCSLCAVWHRRFKRSHVVTALRDASTDEAAADASGALHCSSKPGDATAASSGQPRRLSSHQLAELRLASAKLAAMQQPPFVPLCIIHGLRCDAVCFTCERLACHKCLASRAADTLGHAGAADGGCAGHQLAAVTSDKTAEYARRTRTSLKAAMSHVERCLNAAFSMFGGSKTSSTATAAADFSGGGSRTAATLEAARAADLRRLQANKRLALERVARAHRTAEQVLLEAYDRLEQEAPARRSSSMLMSRQLRRARCYAELLWCADDACRGQQRHSPGEDGRGCDGDGDKGDSDGHDKVNGGNDCFDLSEAAFLDQHGVLLSCVRELLRGSSIAAAPADGFVMVDSGGIDGASGAECDRLGGCGVHKNQETSETIKTIESLLLQQWLRPAIYPSTEIENSSGAEAHSDDCAGDAPCNAMASGGVADDVSGSYGADDDVTSAIDVGTDSSPGGTALATTVAAPTCVASTDVDVTTYQNFEKYAALDDDDASEHNYGGSGCVAADLPDERQQLLPPLLTDCVLCEQPLDDPMLLACLHSCCRRCADAVADMSAACEANGVQNDPARSRVACPLCGVACSASSLKPNRLAAVLLSASASLSQHRFDDSSSSALQTLQPPILHCDVCIDVGEKSEARLTCFVCKQCYCGPCELRHRALHARHSVGPVAAEAAAVIKQRKQQQQPLSNAVAASSCQLVGHDMFCIDCDALRCHFCGKDCIERRHDMAAVNGQRMISLALEAAERLRRLSAAVAVQADQARVAATSRAAAAELSAASGDGAIATVSSDASGLLLVASRARAAESYCNRLLASPDAALVLDQMSAVTSCLETLRSEFDARLSCVWRRSQLRPADC